MATAEARGASTTRVGRARRALDALNFFLADVRGGLGPYLAIYLLTVRDWNEAEIGIVMSISAIAGILAETPGGALIDAIRAKRTVVVLAALVVTAGSLLLPFLSTFLAVAVSQATVSAVGSIFGPAIAAISLGIVGHAHFARRTGRNEAFNHSGNAFAKWNSTAHAAKSRSGRHVSRTWKPEGCSTSSGAPSCRPRARS